jgi:3-phosphoshikimate 1-carboxyvinyltransferase
MRYLVRNVSSLSGSIRVPGDKSISHRSIMLGAIADGVTRVEGFLEGEDALSTMNAFRALGVTIEGPDQGRVSVHGVGREGLKTPAIPLDCGNSGTSMRLMAGLLAGQNLRATMTGDESLSGRPMRRVTDPLALMGANISSAEGGRPPLNILPVPSLKAIDYTLPMASAQVKSAVLLAGLYADGVTTVTEPAPTRDHTERMLKGFGVEVQVDGPRVSIAGGQRLTACNIDVPADISSAAFFLVAASIAEQADITVRHVGINPTRTGIIDILKLMGANLELLNPREVGGEPVADIRVRSAQLKGIDIPEHLVPLAIDEFPVLFIAAANALGRTTLTGAEELRVKESDRIAVMADGMKLCGINAQPTPDGMVIEGLGHLSGSRYSGATVESHGDHRIAMSFTVAALRASSEMNVLNAKNVATSFPNFVELAKHIGFDLTVVQ